MARPRVAQAARRPRGPTGTVLTNDLRRCLSGRRWVSPQGWPSRPLQQKRAARPCRPAWVWRGGEAHRRHCRPTATTSFAPPPARGRQSGRGPTARFPSQTAACLGLREA
eukprot:6427891-Pyramimonas_sp.AAC.1